MYSAYKVNKQGDNIEPWCTLFPILNQSIVSCPVLTVASWPAYTFLRRQYMSSGIPISLRIFNSLLWSTQRLLCSQWRKVDVFREFPCFFYDPVDIGKSIYDSSVFSKFSLYIWKFLVHLLWKPILKEFEHYLAKMWNECNCVAVWTVFGIALWDSNENWPLLVLWPPLSCPNLLAYWVQRLNYMIFKYFS